MGLQPIRVFGAAISRHQWAFPGSIRLHDSEIKEAEWQADNTTEQLANAQDTAQAEGEIPQTENVLTQEANMTQVDPNEAPVPSGDMAGADMDMETAQGQELQGSWNNAQ